MRFGYRGTREYVRTVDIAVVDKEESLRLTHGTRDCLRCLCLFAIRLMGLEERVCFCNGRAI